jgi:predicted negative regulator of RcsB-dependent stress response
MNKAEIKDLKRPDAFHRLTVKMSEGASAYSHFLMILGVVLLVLAVGWTGWSWWSSHREESAQIALYSVEHPYLKKKDDFARAEYLKTAPKPKDQDEDQKKTEPPAAATGDLQKDYGSEVAGLQDMVKRHPHSKAAVLAALDLADIFGQYNQVPKAIESLQAVSSAVGPRDLLYGVVVMTQAALQAINNDCASALSLYERVLNNPRHSFFHPDATLRSAVCLESMKETARAKEMYEQTAERFPESTAGQNAQKYLQLMLMKQAHGPGNS